MAWTERYCSVAGGGAHDGTSAANAWTLAEAITNVAAGHRVNMLAGTYASTTTTRTFATAGTNAAPIWWRGYKTTIGDQDLNNVSVAGTDIPALTFTTGQMVISASFQVFSNLDINGACTTAGGQVSLTTSGIILYRFRAQNTAANANASAITPGTVNFFCACYFKSTTTATACVGPYAGQLNKFVGCQFVSGGYGVWCTTSYSVFYRCIFDSQVNDGIINGGYQMEVLDCSFYAQQGNGINISYSDTSTSYCHLIANNHFENVNQALKAAINNTGSANTIIILCIGNTYYNCTATITGLTNNFSIFDGGTLATAGFVAPSSQNFAMNAIGQNIAFPGLFENTNVYRGYLDPGAVQHQALGGGANLSRVFSGF